MKATINIAYHKTKIGELIIGSYQGKICIVDFRYRRMRSTVDNRIKKGLKAEFVEQEDDIIIEAKQEIDEYLAGQRKEFTLPILMVGTEFQKEVWSALMKIAYGETVSYLELAKSINKASAVRAVASANGANAIALLIPCHRVIESGGGLGGYGGGVAAKKRLLKIENEKIVFRKGVVMKKAKTAETKRKRCVWVDLGNPLDVYYHDRDWGVPVVDDRLLFEMLILEGAQAGLSWATILKKRENYRKAFDNFEPQLVANYDDKKKEQLLQDKGIVRNRLKVNAAVKNAKVFLELQKEYGSFANYIWSFVDYQPLQNKFKQIDEIPAKTELSDTISKDLKKRGMSFVGSTIIYAFMQAVGMVNDHETSCFRYKEVKDMKVDIQ